MKIKYFVSLIILLNIFSCQNNEKLVGADTEIKVQEAHQQLTEYIKTKGFTEEELRLDLDPVEKDKMMPTSQFKEMKQDIDASAERTMTSRLRQKAYAEFDEELNQLLETGTEVEVSKKIDNFDKEIAEKIKEWSKKEK